MLTKDKGDCQRSRHKVTSISDKMTLIGPNPGPLELVVDVDAGSGVEDCVVSEVEGVGCVTEVDVAVCDWGSVSLRVVS